MCEYKYENKEKNNGNKLTDIRPRVQIIVNCYSIHLSFQSINQSLIHSFIHSLPCPTNNLISLLSLHTLPTHHFSRLQRHHHRVSELVALRHLPLLSLQLHELFIPRQSIKIGSVLPTIRSLALSYAANASSLSKHPFASKISAYSSRLRNSLKHPAQAFLHSFVSRTCGAESVPKNNRLQPD